MTSPDSGNVLPLQSHETLRQIMGVLGVGNPDFDDVFRRPLDALEAHDLLSHDQEERGPDRENIRNKMTATDHARPRESRLRHFIWQTPSACTTRCT